MSNPWTRELTADVAEVVTLLELTARIPVTGVRIGGPGWRIEVERDARATPVPRIVGVSAAPSPPPSGAPSIDAPLAGVHYRRPAPGEPPFVDVGDLVEAGQQVAIVEAMKLMNAVVADRTGRVVEIVAGDGEAVDAGAALIRLEPAA